MYRSISGLLVIVMAAALFLLDIGCGGPAGTAPRIRDGQEYGVTQGAFRGRWWNYYERGQSYGDGRFWKDAETDFRAALTQDNTDRRRARTYGMHFIDYFPHRELGVSLFHQGRYDPAIEALSRSLSQEVSAEAQYYLDRARAAKIKAEGLDREAPRITLAHPSPDHLTNASNLTVEGRAADDTFVGEITVNGEPVRIDLSAPEIAFKMKVDLKMGDNSITVAATDLAGRTRETTVTVQCDRAGPLLNIDRLVREGNGGRIEGYAYDDAGIRSITVGETAILQSPGSEIRLDHPVALPVGDEPVLVVAEDTAGNRTRAEIIPRRRSAAVPPEPGRDTGPLLASLDHLPRYLAGRGAITTDGRRSLALPGSPIRSQRRPSPFLVALTTTSPGLESQIRRYRESSTDYALIIGINDYTEWPPLQTAVNDARGLREVLIERYGYHPDHIILRTDAEATRGRIVNDLRSIAAGLSNSENLLIFFAGHGQLDDLTQDGYWIPVEGKRQDPCTWITNSTIKNVLTSERVQGKNILVIADSCYSGTLLRGGPSTVTMSADYAARTLELAYQKSRQVISSGGLEPVADGGRDGHSLFAYYFLKALSENGQPVTDIESLMMTEVSQPVKNKGGQRPTFGRLKTPMDEDGQYVLLLDSEERTDPGISAPGPGADEPASRPSRETFPATAPEALPDTTPPTIEMEKRFADRTVFLDQVYLQGHARDDGGVQNLDVNEHRVLRRPGRSVYFNHLTDLAEGDNRFIIQGVDAVGNRAEQTLTIHRKLQSIYKAGSRMSVVMFPFDREGTDDSSVEDLLLGSLVRSGRFNVKDLGPALKNADDLSEAQETARRMGGDFFLMGRVVGREGALTISARVVEAETAQIITYEDVYGEEVDAALVRQLCKGLVIKLRDAFPLVEGKILKVKADEVIINRGGRNGLKNGMHLIFYQKGEPLIDEDTGEVLDEGEAEEIRRGRIRKVREKIAYVEILEETTDDLDKGTYLVMK